MFLLGIVFILGSFFLLKQISVNQFLCNSGNTAACVNSAEDRLIGTWNTRSTKLIFNADGTSNIIDFFDDEEGYEEYETEEIWHVVSINNNTIVIMTENIEAESQIERTIIFNGNNEFEISFERYGDINSMTFTRE